MVNYEEEKLKFVSNLSGTSLYELISQLTLIPLIYFMSVLIKGTFLFGTSSNLVSSAQNVNLKSKPLNLFIKSFLIDYLFCLIPILLVCTILTNKVGYAQVGLMSFVLYFYVKLKSTTFKFPKCDLNSNKSKPNESIEHYILKLGINSCRLWLYILTCVTILAVDFEIFPRKSAKTETYGVSLMDLGVGFYIVCHSMKIIRNEELAIENNNLLNDLIRLPKKLYETLKSSSILLIIGVLRLISLKSTNYVEHVSEYGIHWNFLFTIVAVKVIVCPLQLIIKQSALKSILMALTIGFYYQYFLIKKNYTNYLLSNKRDTNVFLDANKEGIYSCIGYVAIYLASQSICFRLCSLIQKRNSKNVLEGLRMNLKCVLNLAVFVVLFLFALEMIRSKVQNVSRRLCNLSFLFFVLTCSTMLFAFFILTIVLIAKVLLSFNQRESKRTKDEKESEDTLELKLKTQLNHIFSFAVIGDTKFVGLFIFLLSNLFTGIVNLSINTLKISDPTAFIILSIYTFLCFLLPFLFHFYTFPNQRN